MKPMIRECLKNMPGICGPKIGVPPSGGSRVLPPKGGTPNRISKHALARIFHTPIESSTERRVRTPGLQAPNYSSCRPGALTRRRECEICGLGQKASRLTYLAVFLIALAFFDSAPPLPAAQSSAAVQVQSTNDTEAAYTKAIEKRVTDILALLELKDAAKTAKVHDALIAQYRALRDWHDANDKKLKDATPDAAREIAASLKALHKKFISNLSTELTPQQIVTVKDKMTYFKVKVTYDAYCQALPKLTEPEKQQILEWLTDAREEAMDGGSANEKSAIFKKYKGKINNYLGKQGYDVKQAQKDLVEREKARAGAKAETE